MPLHRVVQPPLSPVQPRRSIPAATWGTGNCPAIARWGGYPLFAQQCGEIVAKPRGNLRANPSLNRPLTRMGLRFRARKSVKKSRTNSALWSALRDPYARAYVRAGRSEFSGQPAQSRPCLYGLGKFPRGRQSRWRDKARLLRFAGEFF